MSDRRKSDALDRRILARLASGEPRALAEIYDRHAERIYRQSLWLLRRKEDAEDVVQTVFVKVASLGPELLAIRRPAAFLRTVAHRLAVDALRRRKPAEAVADSVELELLRAPGRDPDDLALAMAVNRALAELPAEQREAVVLRVYEGLSFREIGEASGVGTFTAASRFRLALARLRKALDVEPESPDG